MTDVIQRTGWRHILDSSQHGHIDRNKHSKNIANNSSKDSKVNHIDYRTKCVSLDHSSKRSTVEPVTRGRLVIASCTLSTGQTLRLERYRREGDQPNVGGWRQTQPRRHSSEHIQRRPVQHRASFTLASRTQ